MSKTIFVVATGILTGMCAYFLNKNQKQHNELNSHFKLNSSLTMKLETYRREVQKLKTELESLKSTMTPPHDQVAQVEPTESTEELELDEVVLP